MDNFEEINSTNQQLDLLRNIVYPSLKEVRANKITQNSPYPSLSPIYPGRLASSVLHVPDHELEEFIEKVVKRYVKTIKSETLKTIHSLIKNKPTLNKVDDEDFIDILTNTAFSRFLNPTLDEQDKILFKKFITPERNYIKVDFSVFESVEKVKGVEIEKTVTLLERLADGYIVRAIFLNSIFWEPRHLDQWELAKYFVLQGAASNLVVCIHPRLHFPYDSINGLTKFLLPKDNIIRQLIEPHCYLHLPLNFAVLYVSKSVAHNNQNEIYTPFPFSKKSFFRIMSDGYCGIKNNSSYPEYRYPLAPETIHSEYGNFLKGYWNIIYEFVSKVLNTSDPYCYELLKWADEASHFVPGFPNSTEIQDKDILVRAVTSFIYVTSVAHSSDHHSYAKVDILKAPMRLRAKPPSKVDANFKLKRNTLISAKDYFRHRICHKMYFEPTNVRTILEVNYPFKNPEQCTLAMEFKSNLISYDRNLKIKKFIPIEEIAGSLQY